VKLLRILACVAISALLAVMMWLVTSSNANAGGKFTGNGDGYTLHLSKKQFRHYCKAQGYKRKVVVADDPGNAYSLRCMDKDGSLQTISVTDVCNYTYADKLDAATGEPVTWIDRLADAGKPFGWDCMPNFGVAGAPDMNRWCSSRGLELFYSGSVYQAYGWFCRNPNNGYIEGIRMDAVCAQTWGPNTLDRVRNVYDVNGWECRYIK
jgi:hypothetical protein